MFNEEKRYPATKTSRQSNAPRPGVTGTEEVAEGKQAFPEESLKKSIGVATGGAMRPTNEATGTEKFRGKREDSV